jgi:hypothetical protein
MVELFQIFSIMFEVGVVLFTLKMSRKRKERYGYAFAFTFIIYVFYDLARLLNWNAAPDLLSLLFLLASVSAFLGMWELSRK